MTDQTRLTVSNDLPQSSFGRLRNEIEQFFEDVARPVINRAGLRYDGLNPLVELVERDKDYRLTAEMPGMDRDDVHISVAGGVLTIKGEKRQESTQQGEGFMLSERRYGNFERRLALPESANPDKIEASFDNGVLTVTIAKEEGASAPRRIPISAA